MGKILFYLPKVDFGGAERVIVSLANEFANTGHQVIFVVSNENICEGISFSPRIKYRILLSKNPFLNIFRLGSLIRNECPKIAISALDNGNLYLLLSKFLGSKSTKFYATIHSNLSQNSRVENSLKARFARYLLSYLYKIADSIIAVSEGVRDDFNKFYKFKYKVKVIYNPVVSSEIIDLSNKKLENKSISNSKLLKIVSVGRFVEAKNFELLIASFALIKTKLPCTLILVGGGPLYNNYFKLINELSLTEDVIFTGFLSNPYNLMREADLFVLSSSYEGLPTVLIEAMACGTKVVSTDCPSGPREILEDGLWGKLVPVGDKQALADAMYESIMDKNSPNVKKRANDFSVEIAAKKYLEHFGLS
jgi:glycosyltransferase involved in cell wall biosynthesis